MQILVFALEDFLNGFSFHEGQPFVAAQMGISQSVLVEPKLMENGGVNVAQMIGALDCPHG